MKIADLDACVIIDSREQHPYEFANPRITTIRRKLPAGDYSIDGYDWQLTIERKELNDLVGTVIQDKERFKRELQILTDYEAACIVVEGDLSDVIDGNYTSSALPQSVFGIVTSICVDYQIPVFFASNRQVARLFCEQWLLRWYSKFEKRKQRCKKP